MEVCVYVFCVCVCVDMRLADDRHRTPFFVRIILEHNGLVFALVVHVLCKAFQELGVFALVDGSQR